MPRISLRVGVPALSGALFVDLLLPNVLTALETIAARTVTLEIHVAARTSPPSADSPKARFVELVERCHSHADDGYLSEYPVLARTIFEALTSWVDFGSELVTHLARDWTDLDWCNGAAGIGLARLDSPLQNDADTRSEIESALEATFTSGRCDTHGLCHGDLGNLEVFLAAELLSGDRRWRAHVQSTVSRVVADVRRFGPDCGLQSSLTSPGLMLGLSGLGFGLLRATLPERVPSILLLRLPTSHASGSRA